MTPVPLERLLNVLKMLYQLCSIRSKLLSGSGRIVHWSTKELGAALKQADFVVLLHPGNDALSGLEVRATAQPLLNEDS